MDDATGERFAFSPANQTAQLIKERLDATSVAIYEHWPKGDSFHLTGCIGREAGVQGPTAVLRSPKVPDPASWTGLTSFVGFHKHTLSVPNSRDGAIVRFDQQEIHVEMDFGARDLNDPGAFLGVPIVSGEDTLGVIRVVRTRGLPAFNNEDERRLTWVSRFLALSFIQERLRVDLIDGLMGIATCDSEDEALERIAQEANRLLNRPSAVFLRERSTSDGSDKYVFRAPTKIAGQVEQREYVKDSGGYTSLVLFEGWPYVLSPNLDVDTQQGGLLQNVRHESKSAETGAAQAKSFVAVPIPGGTAGAPPLGVIRASSPIPYAFSRRDVETLRALARQATVVLRRQAETRERQAFFQTIVDTSPRPIVAIEMDGTIVAYNDALAALLGEPKDDARDKKVLDVLFAGRKRLAKENDLALRSADGKLHGHYTTVYRECPEGHLVIPVRVDASYVRSAATGQPTRVVAYLTDLRGPGADTKITSVRRGDNELRTVDLKTAREVARLKEELKGNSDLHVLITGETGAGKELMAHAAAEALDRPLCRPINCAGLLDSVLESELFGGVAGVATEVTDHAGIFDPDFRGTVILDEIQELSPRVQAQLLRVLDTGKVRRMGAKDEQALGDNIRVVALTNANLDALVDQGKFRADLRFRLNGFWFHLNPLRERPADIMQLADHFLMLQYVRRKGGPQGFASQAIRALLTHKWPGNVRELRKAVELAFSRALAMKPVPLVIPLDCLPGQIREVVASVDQADVRGQAIHDDGDLVARVTSLNDLVGHLAERVKAIEQQNSVHDESFADVLRAALANDPGLQKQLNEGGRQALEEFFKKKGMSPGKSTLFDLLNEVKRFSPQASTPEQQPKRQSQSVQNRTDRK